MNEKKMEWVAMCLAPECRGDGRACKILDRAPNGVWVEAAARIHKRDNHEHVVVVGWEMAVPA